MENTYCYDNASLLLMFIVVAFICSTLSLYLIDTRTVGVNSSGALTKNTARVLFKQMLAGVHHIHTLGWAHRDLSVENFLIIATNGDCRVVVADFGMAVDCTAWTPPLQGTLSPSKPRPGKVSIMAPEIYNYQPYNPFICDAFACGVVLFEMLFAERLFVTPHSTCSHFQLLERTGVKGVIAQRFAERQAEQQAEQMEVLDLLEGLLAIDPSQLLTVSKATNHVWISRTTCDRL